MPWPTRTGGGEPLDHVPTGQACSPPRLEPKPPPLQPSSRRTSGTELLTENPESPCMYRLFPIRILDRAKLSALAPWRSRWDCPTRSRCPTRPRDPMLVESDPPNARDWAVRARSLPLHPELTETEVRLVAEALGSSWNVPHRAEFC